MKILFISDSPAAYTGFGGQAKLLADELNRRGHEIEFICTPCPRRSAYREYHYTSFNLNWMDDTIELASPDVVICLDSTYTLSHLVRLRNAPANCKMYFWLPYEGNLLAPDTAGIFNGVPSDSIVHLSHYAKKIWSIQAPSDIVINHCVDNSSFRDLKLSEEQVYNKRVAWSRRLKQPILPSEPLLINVNRNYWHKRWDACFSILKILKDVHGVKAQMICHTQSKFENGGYDLPLMEEYYGVRGQIIYTDFNPHNGFSLADLNELYNISDCRIDTSEGEGWGLCLSPDSLVTTELGVSQIRNVRIGDKVLTHEGEYKRVLGVTERPESELYDVKCKYRRSVKVTKEHPFLVSDGKGGTVWKNVKELVKSDLIATVKPMGEATLPRTLDLTAYDSNLQFNSNHVWYAMGYSPKESHWSYKNIQDRYCVSKKTVEIARQKINARVFEGDSKSTELAFQLVEDGFKPCSPVKTSRFIQVDDEFLEFVGWYIAEGSTDGNQMSSIEFSLGSDEGHIANWLKDYIKRAFKLESEIIECEDKEVIRVITSGKALAIFMSSLCGIGCRSKKIPDEFRGCEKSLSHLLSGYVMGDGHLSFDRNVLSYTTKSATLAYQVMEAFASNDVLVSVKYNKNRTIYEGQVVAHHLDRAAKLLRMPNNFRRNNTRQHKPTFEENERYFFLPIKHIEKVENTFNFVNDLHVEDSHSFVANGVVVHNTVVEATAAGCPQVVNRHTTMPEILLEEELVPPNGMEFKLGTVWAQPDCNAMAKKVYETLQSGRRAPVQDIGRFYVEVIADQWEDLINTEYKQDTFPRGYFSASLDARRLERLHTVLKYFGNVVHAPLQPDTMVQQLLGPRGFQVVDGQFGDVSCDVCLLDGCLHDLAGWAEEDAVYEIMNSLSNYRWFFISSEHRRKWGQKKLESHENYLKSFKRRKDLEVMCSRFDKEFDYEIWDTVGDFKTIPEGLTNGMSTH